MMALGYLGGFALAMALAIALQPSGSVSILLGFSLTLLGGFLGRAAR